MFYDRLINAVESIAESLKTIAEKPPLTLSIDRVDEMTESEAMEAMK